MTNYPGAEFDQRARQLLAPSDYVNPKPQDKYHLVVIGAGPAGLICAIGAAGLGAKVALVERTAMGGDCLNVGCVPSKALLSFTAEHPEATFAEAFAWLREVRANIAPHDSVARYTEQGVDVFLGEGQFEDGRSLVVGAHRLRARRFAICTGARAALPPIPGLQACRPLTNETVFDLVEAPASLAILGAGAIGCELATVFARLGVQVHLFELADEVLPLEMAAAGQAVRASLEALGVQVHLGTGVDALTLQDGEVLVRAGGTQAFVEQVVVALGRAPNTDRLNLPAAGVATDARGYIQTDPKLRTTNKRIYAAGDCAQTKQFTHAADTQARVVVQNALFAPTATYSDVLVPHCTYTSPEVAAVGKTASELTRQGIAFDEFKVEFDELDRGQASTRSGGFASVYTVRGKDQILGATIVGPDAGEQIAPLCILMGNGLGLAAVQKAILSYPTRSEYLRRLADAYNRTRMTPTVAKVFETWLSTSLKL